MKNKILVIALFILSLFLLVGCGDVSEKTLEPSQTITSVRVKFYVDDEVYLSKKYEIGSKVELPEEPTKEGYKFVGWFTKDGEEISFEKFIVENKIDLYARFEEDTKTPVEKYYKVNFYVNDDLYYTETYVKNEKVADVITPDNPTGYFFIGWYTEDKVAFKSNYIITSDLNVYAKFGPIGEPPLEKYTVTYYVDGNIYLEEKYEEGETLGYIDNPYKENHEFKGWIDFYGVQYLVGDEIYSDLKLYAVFEYVGKPIETYKITYYIDGVYYLSQYCKEGSYLEIIDAPIKEGYEFIGWFDMYGNQYNDGYIYSNINLYARYEDILPNYEVKYYVDGSLDSVELYQEGKYLSYLYTPTTPYNHNFIGWFDENGSQYYGGYIYSNINLYAKFEVIIPAFNGFTYIEHEDYIEITGFKGEEWEIVIPQYINGKPVTRIDGSFIENYVHECVMSTLVLPDTLEYIENGAFENSGLLSAVSISSMKDWLEIEFEDMTANPLYSIVGLVIDGTYLENYAYLEIPYSVTKINEYAFANCNRIYSLVIPNSLNEIGVDAFLNCTSLSRIYYDGTKEEWDNINKNENLLDSLNLNYKEGSISWGINENNQIVEAYLVNYYVEDIIYEYTYCNYSGKLQEPIAPYKEGYEFKGWYCPMFDFMWNFDTTVINPLDLVAVFEEKLDFTYNEYGWYVEITGYIGNSDVVEIPTEINGMPVISIADNSFEGCNFKELIIPSIINDIGNNILKGCDNLEKLTIPYYVNANTPSYLCDYFDGSGFASSANYPSNFKELYINYCDSNLGYFLYESNIETLILGDVWSVDYCSFDNMTYLDKIVITRENMHFSNDALSMHSNVKILFESHINSMNYANIGGIMYSYSGTEPTIDGKYWHYDEFGNAVIWD